MRCGSFVVELARDERRLAGRAAVVRLSTHGRSTRRLARGEDQWRTWPTNCAESASSISAIAAGGRKIGCLSFFVAGEWHSWFAAEGELHNFISWPVEAGYFGDAPERATDQHFPILDLLLQRLLNERMERPFCGLEDDFQNMAASLAQFRLFFEISRAGREVRRFVQTEIEYLVSVGAQYLRSTSGSCRRDLEMHRTVREAEDSPAAVQLCRRHFAQKPAADGRRDF